MKTPAPSKITALTTTAEAAFEAVREAREDLANALTLARTLDPKDMMQAMAIKAVNAELDNLVATYALAEQEWESRCADLSIARRRRDWSAPRRAA